MTNIQAIICDLQNEFDYWSLKFWLLFGYCLPRTALVRGCLPCTMLGAGPGIRLLPYPYHRMRLLPQVRPPPNAVRMTRSPF